MKSNAIIILCTILSVIAFWILLKNNTNSIAKDLKIYERSIRDSLMQDLDRQRVERLVMQLHIDNLTSTITAQKIELTKQITKIKHETIIQVRSYTNDSDSALLDRLRTE